LRIRLATRVTSCRYCAGTEPTSRSRMVFRVSNHGTVFVPQAVEVAAERRFVGSALPMLSLDRKVPTGYANSMAQIEIDVLSRLADKLISSAKPPLTPAERSEILRIAQGLACKDSASAANVSPETIRARRKRIYRKLGLPGASETLSALLALSLSMITTRASVTTNAPNERTW
jgi:DNA-binding CsgD family transcriptional regulator